MGKLPKGAKEHTGKCASKSKGPTGTGQGCNPIVAVEILDGDGKVASDTVKQYVNLPREDKWLDAKTIKNKDRLSRRLRVKVRFKKKGKKKFWLKLAADGANAPYSAGEKSRNTNYTWTNQETESVTEANGTKILGAPDDMLDVTAAGKDTYWAEARDEANTTVTSTKVETLRRLYIQEVRTKGLPPLQAMKLQVAQDEFKKQGIELITLAPVEQAVHDGKVRQTSDMDEFKKAVVTEYEKSSGRAKEPYVVVLAYLHSMTFAENFDLNDVRTQAGPGAPDLTLSLVRHKEPHFLWADRSGAVKIRLTFTPEGTGPSGAIKLGPERIVPVTASTGPAGKYDRIRVILNGLTSKLVSGTIGGSVHVVSSTPGGASLRGTNIIAFCNQADWETVAQDEHIVILTHEIGHKIGMVSDGSDLDKGRFYYDENSLPGYEVGGGQGPHCHCGLPSPDQLNGQTYENIDPKKGGTFDIVDFNSADPSKSTIRKVTVKPQCVMFGFIGSQPSFCPNCGAKLRKKDLGEPKAWVNSNYRRH